MLYASSRAMPVVLDVICFLGRPLRCVGIVAWSTVLWVNGILPRFRDDCCLGLSSGRSDTLVESGVRRLCGPDPGMFRSDNAGCFFGNSVLHTICGAIAMKHFYVL